MLKRIGLILTLLIIAGFWVMVIQNPELISALPTQLRPTPQPKPQPAKYQKLNTYLETQRLELAERY